MDIVIWILCYLDSYVSSYLLLRATVMYGCIDAKWTIADRILGLCISLLGPIGMLLAIFAYVILSLSKLIKKYNLHYKLTDEAKW